VTSDDIAYADVVELQALLTAKHISSLELTNLYLARLEKYGPVYNAVVTLLPERARREARRADRERANGTVHGPLHGIPYGVKDLLATPDAPTTWGAQPYRRQRFDFDATVVQRLTAAGAVLIAKLAMIELAGGFGYNDADASFTGPGRTPWNAAFWSGGSSSGRGRSRRLRDRLGDRGLDRVSVDGVWRDGVASHVRPGQPARRDGALLVAR